MRKNILIMSGLFVVAGIAAFFIHQIRLNSCDIQGKIAPFEGVSYENMYVKIGKQQQISVKKDGSYCFKEFNKKIEKPRFYCKDICSPFNTAAKLDKDGNAIVSPLTPYYETSVFEKDTNRLLYRSNFYYADGQSTVDINNYTSFFSGGTYSYNEWKYIINNRIKEVENFLKVYPDYDKWRSEVSTDRFLQCRKYSKLYPNEPISKDCKINMDYDKTNKEAFKIINKYRNKNRDEEYQKYLK